MFQHLTITFVVIIAGQERGELPDLVQLGRVVGEEGRRKRQRVARHRLQVACSLMRENVEDDNTENVLFYNEESSFSVNIDCYPLLSGLK
jgi:hypothetical protein